jgi:GntR family transcriptional regulator
VTSGDIPVESSLFLDSQDPTPIYAQLAGQVRGLIDAGSWPPGHQVPAVRALAIQLRINPMTVQKVYDLLKQQGYLESRRGQGVFVLGPRRADPREAFERELGRLLARGRQMGLSADEVRAALARASEVSRGT